MGVRNGVQRRGTSNTNDRGSSSARRARKLWLLVQFGDGEAALCAFGCGEILTIETITVDRYPVAGIDGGAYRHGNIRPACADCNCAVHGSRVRRAASAL